MRPRQNPRIFRHKCPKCPQTINVTARSEREKQPAKCVCGWEGFVKDPEGKVHRIIR
jgi:predicted RNA-binding Zn-ribbon protein involved in translation (DUF1610 family)